MRRDEKLETSGEQIRGEIGEEMRGGGREQGKIEERGGVIRKNA